MNGILRDYMLLYRHIDWGTCAVWFCVIAGSTLFWTFVFSVLFLFMWG